MFFDTLTIEKYAKCDSRSLALGGLPGLVLLYGPNEAGKSTTLSAVVDLLYGIPARSRHAELYGGSAIALTATLQFRDSAAPLTVKRTKGNVRTLTDGAGTVFDESVLSAHLGANDRDRFLALFALDHHTLRTGGRQLLEAKGDIGRLILEAGGGLRSLNAELEELARRADSLYGTRQADRRAFYTARTRYQEADKAVKAGLLTFDAYDRARKEHRLAGEKVTELQQTLRVLRVNRGALQRLARVCPLMLALSRQQEALTAFEDLTDEALDLVARIRGYLGAEESVRTAHLAASDALVKVSDAMHALALPEPILQCEAAIREIVELSPHIAKARTDTPNRLNDITESKAKLAGLRHTTAIPDDANIAALMPSADSLDRVRRLAREETEARATITGLQRERTEATAQLDENRSLMDAIEALGRHLPPAFEASRFTGVEALLRDVKSRQAQLQSRQEDLQRRIVALGFDTIDAVLSLRTPDDWTVQSELDRAADRYRQIQGLREAIAADSANRSRLIARIGTIRSGEEVPTTEAIAAAREQRTAAWNPIKSAFSETDPAALMALTLEERNTQIGYLEDRTRNADDLDDRHAREAQRIADLRYAEAELLSAETAIIHSQGEIARHEGEAAEATATWQRTWPDAGRLSDNLPELRSLIAERAVITDLYRVLCDEEREAARRNADLQAEFEALAAAEASVGLEPGIGGIAIRTGNVRQRIQMHSEAYQEYRVAQKRFNDNAVRLANNGKLLEALAAKQSQWQQEWVPLMAALHLKPDASPELASECIERWAGAAGVLTTIAQAQNRLEKMQLDEDRLKAKIGSLPGSLGIDLPEDVVAAANLLKLRLEAGVALRAKRNQFEAQVAERSEEAELAAKRLADVEASIRETALQLGCEPGDLESVAVRYEERARCRESKKATEDQLMAAGDQLPIEQLREQLQGRDLDALQAAIAGEDEREETLETEHQQAIALELTSREELRKYSMVEGMNHPVAERESAATTLRTVIADYLEIKLASELIQEAMAAVREQQQDPLLLRAGQLFRHATNGNFIGIRADVDDKGEPSVVGVRSTDEHVPLDKMSAGTCDQLFLAFRVAAVEQYCANAEPLPFIADDLLVHFDDPRSHSALELLVELGKSTQVLLFTHHISVRDAAIQLSNDLAGAASIRVINMESH